MSPVIREYLERKRGQNIDTFADSNLFFLLIKKVSFYDIAYCGIHCSQFSVLLVLFCINIIKINAK